MSKAVPTLLSFNGGYVDAAGFLALAGLFTAHVTGNFVTLGASLVLGTSGTIGKLLALPVFCVVVMLTRLIGSSLQKHGARELRWLLILKFVLLTAGCASAIYFGPFADADAPQALLTGMLLVAGMAVQNAVHRIHLSATPPSTLMTGTTTQIMIDVADLLHGGPGEAHQQAKARLSRMLGAVLAFALGCGAAGLLYAYAGLWAFIVPPLVALIAVLLKETDDHPS